MSLATPNAGADFALVTDNLTLVSVKQIDPDSGSVLATSTNVPSFSPDETIANVALGLGEVGVTTNDFTLQASAIAFTPKERDQIIDASSNTWVMTAVKLVAFGSLLNVNAVLSSGSSPPPPPPPTTAVSTFFPPGF